MKKIDVALAIICIWIVALVVVLICLAIAWPEVLILYGIFVAVGSLIWALSQF